MAHLERVQFNKKDGAKKARGPKHSLALRGQLASRGAGVTMLRQHSLHHPCRTYVHTLQFPHEVVHKQTDRQTDTHTHTPHTHEHLNTSRTFTDEVPGISIFLTWERNNCSGWRFSSHPWAGAPGSGGWVPSFSGAEVHLEPRHSTNVSSTYCNNVPRRGLSGNFDRFIEILLSSSTCTCRVRRDYSYPEHDRFDGGDLHLFGCTLTRAATSIVLHPFGQGIPGLRVTQGHRTTTGMTHVLHLQTDVSCRL